MENRGLFFLLVLLLPVISSCGGPDPVKDAQAICDCFSRANSLPEENPQRTTEQDKCSELQMQKTSRYQTVEELRNFNEALAACSEEIIRQALEAQ